MTRRTPYSVRLTDKITRQLCQLAGNLAQLPPDEAAQVIARVLDPEDGVLGGFTHVVISGTYFAKDQAERGTLPAEVWLSLGRAANELHDIGIDLDDHKEVLGKFGTQPAATAAKPPAAAPLVVRRHR